MEAIPKVTGCKPAHPRCAYEPYFAGASGAIYFYHDIGVAVRRLGCPANTLQDQLRSVGLIGEFLGGTTPCPLPLRF